MPNWKNYRNRRCKGKAEGFSFPEDLLPACTKYDSSVPLLILVNCLLELLRSGGNYTLLRKLWDCFRATLGPDNPLYTLKWSREESLVSILHMGCYDLTDIVTWYSLSRFLRVRFGDTLFVFYVLAVSDCAVLVVNLPSIVSSSASVAGFANYFLPRLQCVFC